MTFHTQFLNTIPLSSCQGTKKLAINRSGLSGFKFFSISFFELTTEKIIWLRNQMKNPEIVSRGDIVSKATKPAVNRNKTARMSEQGPECSGSTLQPTQFLIIFVPTIANGEELCIRVCYIFFFPRKISYHKKSSHRVE